MIARLFITLGVLLLLPGFTSAQKSKEEYPVHPDSTRQDGVPKGEVTQQKFASSQIFPGTERDYFVYVPSQYDGSKPAALMVFQDGGGYARENGSDKIPIVFDNLIHKGELPVTIAVFVNPGVVPATSDAALPRYNRSFEYDAFDDRYARFLIDEMLPHVVKDHDLKITDDPNLRGICGASSGAIAAFNVAWQRPDAFRRVYSQIGTFVGLRGGNEFPVLIRKTEPKPLRVFLQDGANDLNIYCGDWFTANRDMLSALQWAGYDVAYKWGEGGHSHKHGGAIMPEVMRWLWEGWKDSPEIATHLDRSQSKANDFLVEGEDWELVSKGHGFTEGPVVTDDGTLFFTDLEKSEIWRVSPDGKAALHRKNTGGVNGLAWGPNQVLYGCRREPGGIVAWSPTDDEPQLLASGFKPNDIVVAHDGSIYFTEPRSKKVWLLGKGMDVPVVAGEGYSGVNGVVLSPDQSLVYAADYSGRFVWSGQRKADGTLAHIQPYYHLHIPPASTDSRSQADGMAVSEDGWLLVATAMGLQICDQPGRVHLIVPSPLGERHPSNVTFGGPDRQTLYATCGSKVFKRKVKLKGALPWKAPMKPEKPRL